MANSCPICGADECLIQIDNAPARFTCGTEIRDGVVQKFDNSCRDKGVARFHGLIVEASQLLAFMSRQGRDTISCPACKGTGTITGNLQ